MCLCACDTLDSNSVYTFVFLFVFLLVFFHCKSQLKIRKAESACVLTQAASLSEGNPSKHPFLSAARENKWNIFVSQFAWIDTNLNIDILSIIPEKINKLVLLLVVSSTKTSEESRRDIYCSRKFQIELDFFRKNTCFVPWLAMVNWSWHQSAAVNNSLHWLAANYVKQCKNLSGPNPQASSKH